MEGDWPKYSNLSKFTMGSTLQQLFSEVERAFSVETDIRCNPKEKLGWVKKIASKHESWKQIHFGLGKWVKLW